MMNSSGHNKTPHVKEKDSPDSPNKVKFTGSMPNSFSSENILPPMHSAISAFATKNAAMKVNTFVGRSFRKFLTMMWSYVNAI